MHDPFKSPERVSEEPNDIRHVGYQFSQFSTLKMNTGSTHHKNFESDSHGVAHGGLGLGALLEESQRNLMIQGMLGINSAQISALKMNTRSTHLKNLESDSHEVAHGGSGPGGLLEGSQKNLMIQGMMGINSAQISALKTKTGSTHL